MERDTPEEELEMDFPHLMRKRRTIEIEIAVNSTATFVFTVRLHRLPGVV